MVVKNKIRLANEDTIIEKRFSDKERYLKEAGLLNILASTALSAIVPKIIEQRQIGREEIWLIRMSRIKGRSSIEEDLNLVTAGEFGKLLGSIHEINSYACCGSFDKDVFIIEQYTSFYEFISSQSEKWHSRLTVFSDKYETEVKNIKNALISLKKDLEQLFLPRFGHNDFDFKNIMIADGRVSGIIDWEFAGAYPLSWELRKIIPALFWKNPDYGRLFVEAYSRKLNADISLPNLQQQALFVAVDCIGALSWSFRQRDQEKIRWLTDLIQKAVKILS